MRWVGIDESGYGPNLGPLVMTAVVAEGPPTRRPDFWADCAPHVSRAGGPADALWVDDSKRVFRGRAGGDRLEAACFAVLKAAGRGTPATLNGLCEALSAGTPAAVETARWVDGHDPAVPTSEARGRVEVVLSANPFASAAWRIADVRSVVMGPGRFNRLLAESGSKATVHFEAFASLARWLWETTAVGGTTAVCGDKHGGRHYYLGPLSGVFPDPWIDRGPEGPEGSRYTIRGEGRRLELELLPRADSEDGLVALASLVSKAVREYWMTAFNGYWQARIDGLQGSAGYPVDARRFRAEIEPHTEAAGIGLDSWWRRS